MVKVFDYSATSCSTEVIDKESVLEMELWSKFILNLEHPDLDCSVKEMYGGKEVS